MTEMTREYRDAIIRRLVGLPVERDQKDERDPGDGDTLKRELQTEPPTLREDEGGESPTLPGEVSISGENLAEPLKVTVNLPINKQGKKR